MSQLYIHLKKKAADGQGIIVCEANPDIQSFEYEREMKLRELVEQKKFLQSEKKNVSEELQNDIEECQNSINASLDSVQIDSNGFNDDFEKIRSMPPEDQRDAIINGLHESGTRLDVEFGKWQIEIMTLVLRSFHSLALPKPTGFKQFMLDRFGKPNFEGCTVTGADPIFAEQGAATNSGEFLTKKLGPHIIKLLEADEVPQQVILCADQGGFNKLVEYCMGATSGKALNIKLGIMHTLVALLDAVRKNHGDLWLAETFVNSGITPENVETLVKGKPQWSELIHSYIGASIQTQGNFFLDYLETLDENVDIRKIFLELKGWPEEIEKIFQKNFQDITDFIKFQESDKNRLRKFVSQFGLEDSTTFILLWVSQRCAIPDLEILALRRAVRYFESTDRKCKYAVSTAVYLIHICLEWHPKAINDFWNQLTTPEFKNSCRAMDTINELWNLALKTHTKTGLPEDMIKTAQVLPELENMRHDESEFSKEYRRSANRPITEIKSQRRGAIFLREKSFIFNENLINSLDLSDSMLFLRHGFDRDIVLDSTLTTSHLEWYERGDKYVTSLFETRFAELKSTKVLELSFEKKNIPLYGTTSSKKSICGQKDEENLWNKRNTKKMEVEHRKKEAFSERGGEHAEILQSVIETTTRNFEGPLGIQNMDGTSRTTKKSSFFDELKNLIPSEDRDCVEIKPVFVFNSMPEELFHFWALGPEEKIFVKNIDRNMRPFPEEIQGQEIQRVSKQYILDAPYGLMKILKKSLNVKAVHIQFAQRFVARKFDQGYKRVILCPDIYEFLIAYKLKSSTTSYRHEKDKPLVSFLTLSTKIAHCGSMPPKLKSLYFSSLGEFLIGIRESLIPQGCEIILMGFKLQNYGSDTVFVLNENGLNFATNENGERFTCRLPEADFSIFFALDICSADLSIIDTSDTDVKIYSLSLYFCNEMDDEIALEESGGNFISVKSFVKVLHQICVPSSTSTEDHFFDVKCLALIIAFLYIFTGNDYLPHVVSKQYWAYRLPQICQIISKIDLPLIALSDEGECALNFSVLAGIFSYISIEKRLNFRKRTANYVDKIDEVLTEIQYQDFQSLYDFYEKTLNDQNEHNFSYHQELFKVLDEDPMQKQATRALCIIKILSHVSSGEMGLTPSEILDFQFEIQNGLLVPIFETIETINKRKKLIENRQSFVCGKGCKKCLKCRCSKWHLQCSKYFCRCSGYCHNPHNEDNRGYCASNGERNGIMVYTCPWHPLYLQRYVSVRILFSIS